MTCKKTYHLLIIAELCQRHSFLVSVIFYTRKVIHKMKYVQIYMYRVMHAIQQSIRPNTPRIRTLLVTN